MFWCKKKQQPDPEEYQYVSYTTGNTFKTVYYTEARWCDKPTRNGVWVRSMGTDYSIYEVVMVDGEPMREGLESPYYLGAPTVRVIRPLPEGGRYYGPLPPD